MERHTTEEGEILAINEYQSVDLIHNEVTLIDKKNTNILNGKTHKQFIEKKQTYIVF